MCFAPSEYSGEATIATYIGLVALAGRPHLVLGACAAEADLSEMNLEQKQAFANICNVEFPCQVGCFSLF